jgi:feruloyl-CoA synthase
MRAKLMALEAEASGSAQRVLRFAFLAAKLSIDTGELTDKGAVSQRNILRRHAALIEKLYADSPADNVICLESARGIGLDKSPDALAINRNPL